MALKWDDLGPLKGDKGDPGLNGIELIEATDESDAQEKSWANPTALVWWAEA